MHLFTRLIATLLYCLCCVLHVQAQNPTCGADALLQQKLNEDPLFKAHHDALELQRYQWQKAQESSPEQQKSALPSYVIPVVVHLIHQNGPENLSDLQVEQGIQHLNEAFANIGYYGNGDGVATPFQFCLARRKPDGSPTNGIDRVQSVYTVMDQQLQDLTVKNLSRWDPTQYINIWVVKYIAGNLAGYAFFPSAYGLDVDGIVMEAEWFGTNHSASTVLVHEMGHYLGLYHTFQDGCYNNDCLSDGDRVCDTPPDQSTAWTPCGSVQNSCNTDTDSGFATDQNDMTINYMDYATWDCYNAFTQGQSSRMEFFLLNVRQSLLQSQGCKDPCLNPVVASYTTPAGSTLPAGTNVLFTNTSTNGVNYEWTVNGTVVGTSTDLNYTFINEGMQVVVLKVAGSDPNCTDFTADTFFVVCPIQASFILDNPNPAPGDVIYGISTGSGASQYEWTMNGVPFGNASTATVTMPGPGFYSICMTASNAYCVRTVCEGISLEDTTDCDDNLFRLVFTPASMGDFVPLPNGSYLTGGAYWADSLHLMHLTPDGEVSSSRSFNVFPGEDEYMLDLEVVSGGYVIGIGSTVHYAPVSEWKCFAFKYDYQNQSFVWLRTFEQANFHFDIFKSDIKELPGSGNYLVNSQNRSNYARSMQLILDKTTGDVVSGKDFGEINTTIGLKKMIRAGQQFFTVGYRLGSAPHPGTLLSAWDDAGQLLWSKEYSVSQTNMYAFQLAHLNNHLYLLSDGADTNRYFVVIKTDLYGQPVWSRRVDLPYNTLLTNGKTITPVGDGLVVHLNDVTADRSWFYKFNEAGQLVWTRTMEMPTKFVINDIQAEGNDLWLVGFQSITAGRSVLLRINPEKSFGGTCKLYAETTATASDFPVTVNDRVLLTSNLNYTEQSPNVLLRPVPFILHDWCPVVTCPEICGNGLDDDTDGYVDCFDVDDCPCDDLPACISIGVVPAADHRIAGKLDWASPGGMAYIGWTPVTGNLNPKQDNMPEIIAGKIVNSLSTDELLIYRGDGGDAATPQKLIIPERLSAFHPATPAIGDLNGDSIPELVVICADHRMRVYTNYQPGANPVMTLMAVSTDTTILVPSSKPLLADFDADGISEIYLGNEVFRFDFSTSGSLVLRRTAPAVTVPNGRETHDDRTSCSIAADFLKPIDCAGDPDCNGLEIAAGYAIYSVDLDPFDGDPAEIKKQRDLSNMQPAATYTDGHTTAGDVDLDGILDVLVSGRRAGSMGVYVWNKNGLVRFFPLPTFGAPHAGLVAVGNVFDDKLNGAAADFPEMLVYARDKIYALNINAANQTPAAPWWWTLQTSTGSGFSSVSLFDFNTDGFAEAVARDKDSLYMLYGGPAPFPPGVNNKRSWFSFPVPSNFLEQYPIIADVDDDGGAEVVVVGRPLSPYSINLLNESIVVLEADITKGVPWGPARPLWNQFNYYPVSVNDDLSIPKNQQASQLEFPFAGSGKRPLNLFLGQPSKYDQNFNPYTLLPDVSVSVDTLLCAGDTLNMSVQICNNGSGILPSATPLRLYAGDPLTTNAVLLPAMPVLPKDVAPDSCVVFEISFAAPPAGQTVYLVANDDGSKATPFDLAVDFPVSTIAECNYTNNIAAIALPPTSPPPLDLGPDIAVCENGIWTFDAGPGFVSYQWSDLTAGREITVYLPGTYWVEARDVCGNVYSDTVKVNVDTATMIELGADTVVCSGAMLHFNVTGFAEYQWFPADDFSCTGCGNPSAQPSDDVTYTVVAKTSLGCYTTDSIRVTMGQAVALQVDTAACAGSTITLFGTAIPAGSSQVFTFNATTGCDSTVTVTVAVLPVVQTTENQTICAGDSVLIFNQWQHQAGVFSQTFNASGGCDSTHIITLAIVPAFQTSESRTICAGDSVLIFNQWQHQAGVFSQIFTALGGCDSTHTVTLAVVPEFQTSESRAICAGDSALIFNQWQHQAGVFSQSFTAADGCDSTHTVTLAVVPEFQTSESRAICAGDSVFIFNQWENQVGVFSQTFTASGGCDSVHTVTLAIVPEFQTLENRAICAGDSVLIFNQWKHQAGVFSQIFTATGGCDSTHTIVLVTTALPVAEFESTQPLCPGDSNGSITAVNGATGLEYSLNGADFQSVGAFDQLNAGDYTIRVRDSLGCVFEENILLPEPAMLTLELPGDMVIQPGQPVQLFPQTSGGNLNYIWSPTQFLDCWDCSNPVATPALSVTYTLTIQNGQGCSLADSVTIRVQEAESGIFIPNIIRPGSGYGNDLFAVSAPAGVREVVRMEIYDRWGDLLFSRGHFAADGTTGWDGSAHGQAVLPGVYVYVLELELEDGTREVKRGDVTVVR